MDRLKKSKQEKSHLMCEILKIRKNIGVKKRCHTKHVGFLEYKITKEGGSKKRKLFGNMKIYHKGINYEEGTHTYMPQTSLNARDLRTLALLHTYVLKI